MKKIIILLLLLVLFPTLVSASHNDTEDAPDRGFFDNIFGDLVDSIKELPRIFFEFILELINAPIKPLLSFIKMLLSEPIQTSIFKDIWSIIVYVFSFFFSLILVINGFYLMISGYDVEKREKAKDWIKNTFILLMLLPASYFLYNLILEFGAALTKFVINFINPDFFMITGDSLTNIFLEIVFTLPYLIILLITCIVLIIRYVLISAGVVLFPIGLFFYFVNPLRSYGQLIINFLMANIFVSFINAILLLAFSKIIELSIFSHFKILVMISAFFVIDLITLFVMVFAIIKAAFNISKKVVAPIVSLGKLLV